MTGGAATALAVASGAWYYHQFGRPAFAMTPAEEGCVIDQLNRSQLSWKLMAF